MFGYPDETLSLVFDILLKLIQQPHQSQKNYVNNLELGLGLVISTKQTNRVSQFLLSVENRHTFSSTENHVVMLIIKNWIIG